MWNWLSGLWSWLVNLFSVVLPFAKSGAARGIPPAVRWVLHGLVLLAVLVGLYFLNAYFGINRLIPNPPWARDVWLPLLFLLLYAAGWLLWVIWQLAMTDPGEGAYPDVDEAWDEALQALDRAGIRLTETPLFLVVGRTESPETSLFQAAQLPLLVRKTPAEDHAPLHVYANRDAIFVTCAGASLLGKQAANLTLEGISEQDADGASPVENDYDPDKTQIPKEKETRAVHKIVMPGRKGAVGSPERRALRRALGLKIPSVMRRADEVERLSGALAHLCRRIRRDRHPECPLNGILLLLPLGATDTEEDTQIAAEVVQRDLGTIRATAQLHCPIFALVCDLEAIPGFRAFLDRQTNKKGRIGQRFPLESPDLGGPAILDALERSVALFCQRGLRDLVYPLFDVPAEPEAAADGPNRDLYLLLDEMRQRKDRFGRILSYGLKKLGDGPLLFGGCYLAATGADENAQAFVKGVFTRLVESQSYVAWTDEALRQDDARSRAATIGYAVIGLLVLAVGGLGYFQYRQVRGR